MFKTLLKLKRAGIVGINRRNADYILRYNQRALYPLVDDKLHTKRLAIAAGIAVPDLYGVIEIEHDIASLPEIVRGHQDFVIKPAHGSGGNGIAVIVGRINDRYQYNNGNLLTEEELEYHISNILSGMYSLGGQPDQALIEYRVKFDPIFEPISYRGVPDIRTIVFRGIPVASMVRLPTRMSDGKANLHQGAVGAGIDLTTGCTTRAVWQNRPVEHHPDTGASISGFQIPHWNKLLTLAAQCYELVGLGYLGVDVVLDQKLGPLVLELNARPGLSIQIANGQGIQKRLEYIDRLAEIPSSAESRASLAQQLFVQI
ncbi:alpha-L-glutamate ligase-like protein [Nitrosomonas nitrosa]|jgi:alpha-L-glutamate ligase-like protein|uniref:Alpha-L-glutamate ligase-related protein n=1 Tax=Nitrosomonas nitrosa TaxID=52442 RepID=A0A8H8YXL9_9PROT|nr:alpha-L-glutamate ligase-like protein [Nitrosomonas nitrosa]MCO6433674.1 alpha-L-glutamate ligase-like protein [Nitrosomonas nitrosa]PTR02833.1 alpha-L-glutamate ligase-like protein [Nitrosomonas nitrosa]CAE6483855.1 Alpha-L-glutamate ligase-related protein [Nitrosomonas nitrosa]